MRSDRYDPAAINPNPLLALVFMLDAEEQVWTDCAVLALYRLYWRVTYRHMTRLLIEGKPFWPPAVETDLCRSLMETILSYQSKQRTHYLAKVDTAKTEVLPLKAASQVSSLGTLCVFTGELTVAPALVLIMKEYKVWRDYGEA